MVHAACKSTESCCPGCFRSRYRILLSILFVLTLQLSLWIFVVMKPANRITIYLDGSELHRDQIEFENAIFIDITKTRMSHRAQSVGIHKKHKRRGMLTKFDNLKVEERQIKDTDPLLIERSKLFNTSWSTEVRQRYLEHLLRSHFTDDLSPLSDSFCPIAEVKPPESLCRQSYGWECNHSPTYTIHHRHNRSLTIDCPGDFRVNWYFERDGGLTSDVMKNYSNQYSVWGRVPGPINIPFPTQYADVLCRIKTDNGTKTHHNYRTQLLPNMEVLAKQRRIFDDLKQKHEGWQPISILSINIDSLSRAQFHRSCGLPKTQQLLQQLFNANVDSSHQAFLFNRLNSIGGVTAMNLTPLYAGIFFKRADEEKRVLIHRYTKPIKEWMWDYANQHGYLTSYAMDTGNGIMGTQTICPSHS